MNNLRQKDVSTSRVLTQSATSPPLKANLYKQFCIRLNNNKLKKRYTLKKKEEKGKKFFK